MNVIRLSNYHQHACHQDKQANNIYDQVTTRSHHSQGPPTRALLHLPTRQNSETAGGARTRKTLDPLATAGAVADALRTAATASATARHGALPLKHITTFAPLLLMVRVVLREIPKIWQSCCLFIFSSRSSLEGFELSKKVHKNQKDHK